MDSRFLSGSSLETLRVFVQSAQLLLNDAWWEYPPSVRYTPQAVLYVKVDQSNETLLFFNNDSAEWRTPTGIRSGRFAFVFDFAHNLLKPTRRVGADIWANVTLAVANVSNFYGLEEKFVVVEEGSTFVGFSLHPQNFIQEADVINITVANVNRSVSGNFLSVDFGSGSPVRAANLAKVLLSLRGSVEWGPPQQHQPWYNDRNVVGIVVGSVLGFMVLVILVALIIRYRMNERNANKVLPEAQELESALAVYSEDEDLD